MTEDERARDETRKTIGKIFDYCKQNNEMFHALDKTVAVMATDSSHIKEAMKGNGCGALVKEARLIRKEIEVVDDKHDKNFIKTSAFIKATKYLIIIGTGIIVAVIGYFKK